MFGPRVYIVDSGHLIESVDVPMNRQPDMVRPVTIGMAVGLAHAVILSGVTIGRFLWSVPGPWWLVTLNLFQ